MPRQLPVLKALLAVTLILSTGTALADTGNFELNGKTYTKLLYKNDDSRGCLSLSNPFWPDNIGGSNGVCTEFELNVLGRVSKYVTAGVRIQSRWGALWQDWWENGDTRWDYPNATLFYENTSGESQGLNHAQYMKLRGVFIRAALPIPTVRWVHIGATDLGMFNEWTIGKSRYIDRDNGAGVFFEGEIGDFLRYHSGAIALPKLFVGPRWTTGLQHSDPLSGFWGADWAYAAKLEAEPHNDFSVRLIGALINDWEADRFDPDITGASDAGRDTDRAISWDTRFRAVNATLDARYTPEDFTPLSVTGLIAFSSNKAFLDYATNSVENDQGFSPVLFLFDLDDEGRRVPRAAKDFAGRVRVEVLDPFEVGVSLRAEYFNIGEDFNAIFGSRREADVLLTDGIIPSGFISGGQLPTLNLANEFVDFDEPWYESVIGWHGGTGILEWTDGGAKATGEYSLITYNTNAQDRDVDFQYPDFLYTDGFTDPQAYTADFDYANIYDRGKDPRSVYKKHQNRMTSIVALGGELLVPGVDHLLLQTKLKWVRDRDTRSEANANDNYLGNLYLAFLTARYQWTDELSTGLGYELQVWDEKNRSGSQEDGFFDYDTKKHTGRLTASYNFGGLSFNYLLEYFHKDQERARPGSAEQEWRVWRSKATVEVGF
jgi:hypothetical protein